MSEQNNDLASWWNEQTFAHKELYTLRDNGELVLVPNMYIKERTIATLSTENAEVVLKNLQDKYTELAARIKETELEWLASEDKLKMINKVEKTREALNTSEAVGDIDTLAKLVHGWEHTIYELTEESYLGRLKLVEEAEALTESDKWKETTQLFKDITEKWKQAGYLDKSRSDKLWNRIEAARTKFYDRKREHTAEYEKDMLQNLDLKMEVVDKAEKLAASEEWKKATEEYSKLMEEWKAIGRTMTDKQEALWQRFIAAKSVFFDRKKAHYDKVHVEQEANYVKKMALVEKAEAMKDNTDWGTTAQAYATLMEEWKKTGRIPQDKGDELWKRFTEAQEVFFQAKHKQSQEMRETLESNQVKKQEILDRAEQIQNSTHWGDTTAEMNELMDEWKKIGPVPRAQSNKMWEAFLAARKNFFNRKDANRDQRKQYVEKQKEVRVQDAKNSIQKLHDDIKEETERIADFKVDIQNITPSRKAEELRAHLQNLITQGETKLKRLQEKLDGIHKDVADSEKKASKAAVTENDENSAPTTQE